jgi:hypothetical protein
MQLSFSVPQRGEAMITFPFRALFPSSASSPHSDFRPMKRTRPGARQQAAQGLDDTNSWTAQGTALEATAMVAPDFMVAPHGHRF